MDLQREEENGRKYKSLLNNAFTVKPVQTTTFIRQSLILENQP